MRDSINIGDRVVYVGDDFHSSTDTDDDFVPIGTLGSVTCINLHRSADNNKSFSVLFDNGYEYNNHLYPLDFDGENNILAFESILEVKWMDIWLPPGEKEIA